MKEIKSKKKLKKKNQNKFNLLTKTKPQTRTQIKNQMVHMIMIKFLKQIKNKLKKWELLK